MKVLIDAQLPQRLTECFSAHNIDAQHTLDLPKKNATPDQEIIRVADQEDRIVVSKDHDFLDNYILENHPHKLLLVSTGNINNNAFIQLFEQNIETLKSLFEKYSVIEISVDEIQMHY